MGEKYFFRLYKDRAGGWRWRLKSANGQIVADSGESYSQRSNAIRALRMIREQVIPALIEPDSEAWPRGVERSSS